MGGEAPRCDNRGPCYVVGDISPTDLKARLAHSPKAWQPWLPA